MRHKFLALKKPLSCVCTPNFKRMNESSIPSEFNNSRDYIGYTRNF